MTKHSITTNKSIEYNVVVSTNQRKTNLSMERYLIEYKQPIIQRQLVRDKREDNLKTDGYQRQIISYQGSQPILGGEFIEITTGRYFYLFRMTKIIPYDYFYYKNNTSKVVEDSTSKKYSGNNGSQQMEVTNGGDLKSKTGNKRNSLPVIIDLSSVDTNKWRENRETRIKKKD